MTQLALWILHIEAFAKGKIAKDVENQVGDLVLHVHRLGQLIALSLLLTKQLQPSIDVLVDECFSIAQCALRKRKVEHSALAAMLNNVGGAPGVNSILSPWPDLVIVALPHVALGSKNGPVG